MNRNELTVNSFKKCVISNSHDGIEYDTLLEKVKCWKITMVILRVIVVMQISVNSVTNGNLLLHYHFVEHV